MVGPAAPAAARNSAACAPSRITCNEPRFKATPICWVRSAQRQVSRVSDVMLGWTKEDAPRWDADKQRLFTTEALAAVGMEAPQAGYAIADEWWRVTNDGGDVVGYGWLDAEWATHKSP